MASRNQKIAVLKVRLSQDRPMLEIVSAPSMQPQELFLQIGKKRYQVGSVAEAVAMHNAARDAAEHGASGMPRVTIVSASGAHLYGISYNGRVWDGNKPLDGLSSDEWMARGRHVNTAVSAK